MGLEPDGRVRVTGFVLFGLVLVIFQYLIGELLTSKRRSDKLQRIVDPFHDPSMEFEFGCGRAETGRRAASDARLRVASPWG